MVGQYVLLAVMYSLSIPGIKAPIEEIHNITIVDTMAECKTLAHVGIAVSDSRWEFQCHIIQEGE